ncbi:MAG: metallophosphoesterase [Thermofilum sp.]
MRKAALLLVFLVVLLPANLPLAQPPLPGVPALASQTASSDISIGKPAVVTPGGSFSFSLSTDPGPLKGGYIYSVVFDGGRLVLLNYTLTLSYSAGKVSASLPSGVRPGLYDLVVVGQARIELPRSVWVLDPSKTSFRIVHVTDQHYGAGQPDILTGDTNRFAGYVVASLLAPDFIVDTGDLADTVNERYYRWAVAYERAFLYSYPIFAIPGNHDTPSDSWSKHYGSPTWYRLIGDKLLIIGLYTYEQGYAPLEQLRWAEEVLKQHASVPYKVIMMHHPVFYYQGELKTTHDDERVIYPYSPQSPGSPLYSSWSGNMEATRYFLRIVEENGVFAVFSGHVHRDLYVKYTSTRTGRTTYFLTATTLGMGSAIYDGLGFYEIDLKSGSINFPVKTNTFIGFANDTGRLAQNSIPVGTYPPPNNLGVSNQVFTPSALYQWPHAYVLTLENRLGYLNLENVAVWCLPWSGEFSAKIIESAGGAEFSVLDTLSLGGELYLAVRIKLPPGGRLVVALSNAPDTSPPTVKKVLLIPEQPQPGSSFQALVEVEDSGWGIARFTATLVSGGAATPLEAQIYTPGTFADPISSFTYRVSGKVPAGSGEVKLVFSAVDFAGNKVEKEIVISRATEQPPSPPAQPPPTQPPEQPPAQPPEQPAPEQPAPQPAFTAQPMLIAAAAALLLAAIVLLVVAGLRTRRKAQLNK